MFEVLFIIISAFIPAITPAFLTKLTLDMFEQFLQMGQPHMTVGSGQCCLHAVKNLRLGCFFPKLCQTRSSQPEVKVHAVSDNVTNACSCMASLTRSPKRAPARTKAIYVLFLFISTCSEQHRF